MEATGQHQPRPLYSLLLLSLLTANGFVPGGSGTKKDTAHKVTHHTNKTQHTQLQKQ
jgi:hypothetical protein